MSVERAGATRGEGPILPYRSNSVSPFEGETKVSPGSAGDIIDIGNKLLQELQNITATTPIPPPVHVPKVPTKTFEMTSSDLAARLTGNLLKAIGSIGVFTLAGFTYKGMLDQAYVSGQIETVKMLGTANGAALEATLAEKQLGIIGTTIGVIGSSLLYAFGAALKRSLDAPDNPNSFLERNFDNVQHVNPFK